MKGLALNVIWALIIAIVSVLLFLSLVTGVFKSAANWFYCDVYIKIVNFFRGDMASIPDICKPFYQQPKVENIYDTDNKIFSRKLLAYIIACWQDAEIREFYESHPCYELRLSGNVENVSEENVTRILIKEDHCRSIENSDYGCGVNNQIVWSVDGDVVSLKEENVSDAINNCTIPSSLNLNETMIHSVAGVKRKIQLKNFLANEIPKEICNSLSQCGDWEYNSSIDEITFSVSSKEYKYSIDSVLSYLEKEGLIRSVIEDQKILLIEYNGPKEAVEVIG